MRTSFVQRITRVFSALVIAACILGTLFSMSGCGESTKATSNPPTVATPNPQPPRVPVKRVLCRVKIGPLSTSLEVDLSELKNLVLDAKQLCKEIVLGDPGTTPPKEGQPEIMVVSKKTNKITYFQLAPNVKEVRLKSKEAGDIELIVKNQDPLKIELWTNSTDDVLLDVEFKDPIDPKKKD